MVANMCTLFGLIFILSHVGLGSVNEVNILEAENKELIEMIKVTDYLLVLMYGEECGELCEEDIRQLQQVSESILIADLQIVKNAGTLISETYGVKRFPSLVFYRKGYPSLYPAQSFEAEDLAMWIELNRDVSTKILTDSTFEHDTQASTGATTGDWFVMFYSSKCSSLIATWEAVASRLKQRLNMAKIDLSKNPGLSNRFSITKCPALILFRLGKMYHYDLPDMDHNSLTSFATGWYKNAKSERVSIEASPFDKLTANIAKYIKEKLDSPNGNYYILGAAATLGVILLTCLLCFTSKQRSRQKFD